MNKKSNYLKLSTIFFSLLLAVVFSLAIPNTSKAASLGKVTNIKQTYGSYNDEYNAYIVMLKYNKVAGATGYFAEISTDKVNWEPAKEYSTSNIDTFAIGLYTKLKPASTYYVRITPYQGDNYYDSADTSAPIQVVTAPAAVSGSIKQTGAKTNSVTASWNKVAGATGYKVYVKKSGDSEYIASGTTTSTSYKLAKYNGKKLTADSIYYIGVCATKTSESGFVAESLPSSVTNFCTLPNKTKKIIAASWKPGTSSLKIMWTPASVASGYDVYFYNSKNKVVKKATSTTNAYTFTKAPKAGFCSVKVRPYIKTDNGKKIASSWSKKTYFISQSSIKNDFTLVNGKLTIKWTKVSGASNYAVYAGTSATNMKKVATVSSKKTSCTIKKISGSTVSKYGTYYVKVIPQKKVSGTTYKGDHGWYSRLRMIYYY